MSGIRQFHDRETRTLSALPPGGEVPDDYVFEAAGARGASTVIGMSELFRGGDTLMMYH